MREILTGKDRVTSFQSLSQMAITSTAIFICYRNDVTIWKAISFVIILNVILIWFHHIFNHALNHIYLERYDADVAQQAEELASMVTQKKIFKKTMIKDVLEKLSEEEGK
jgi:hypothetical protein